MTQTTPLPAAQTIVLERTLRAPIEDIWSLWTTKDGFESWWGPEGFRVQVHTLEARVGGALSYDMIADAPEHGKVCDVRVIGRLDQIAELVTGEIQHRVTVLDRRPDPQVPLLVGLDQLGVRHQRRQRVNPLLQVVLAPVQIDDVGLAEQRHVLRPTPGAHQPHHLGVVGVLALFLRGQLDRSEFHRPGADTPAPLRTPPL